MDWDHLRSFEAVARLGSLTRAARALRVSQSIMSRHLQALEREAGSPLLLRETPVVLTRRGEAVLAAARPMVDHALAAQSALEASPELVGEVVVATVGELLRWDLVQRLLDFFQQYPGLRLRLLADNLLHSLATGEADIALRFGRPEGPGLVGHHLSTITSGYFVKATLKPAPGLPWLGLAGTLASLPEQRHAERAFKPRQPRLLVEDMEALGLAVQAGMGVAILPHLLAERLDGVVEVAGPQVGVTDTAPIPVRPLWLVVHRSRQQLPTVRAVTQWLEYLAQRDAAGTGQA